MLPISGFFIFIQKSAYSNFLTLYSPVMGKSSAKNLFDMRQRAAMKEE